MLTHNALLSRVSTPTRQLAAPGPSDAQLLAMLQTAVHVPDHGKRVPFRFLRITGDARTQLADAAQARLLQLEPEAGAAVIEKLRSRFTMPPLTIAVIARLGEDEKNPGIRTVFQCRLRVLPTVAGRASRRLWRAVVDRLASV